MLQPKSGQISAGGKCHLYRIKFLQGEINGRMRRGWKAGREERRGDGERGTCLKEGVKRWSEETGGGEGGEGF